MSAIFGFCSFDNLPALAIKERIQIMQSTLVDWAADGFKTEVAASAGFGIAVQALRDLDLHLPPPVYIQNRSLLFTASARLDNRPELLNGSTSENKTKHDSDLILDQYLQHEENTPDTLAGDWAFAAFDSRKKDLTLARDHIGNTALYYTANRSFIAFAPSPHALLALNGVSDELDEWKLACDLARFPQPEAADHTKWKEIRQLLPSHRLTANTDTASVSVKRYWSFKNIPSVHLSSDEEYYEQFRELMSQAVKTRISGYEKVGTTLSSGFDSGAVTAFAAKLLAEKNKTLTAYTSIPLYKNVTGMRESVVDEWPIAHSHTRLFPNINHIPVDGQRSTPHRVLKKIVFEYGETVLTTGNAFWVDEILQKASENEIRVLLTGQMGNGGISWDGSRNQILYHFIEGRWLTGLHSAREFKKKYGIHWFKVLKYLFLWQLLSPIKKTLKQIGNSNKPLWNPASPIHPAFAERMNLNAAIRDSSFTGYKNTLESPGKSRVQIMEVNAPIVCASWHLKGAHHNLDILDPTADLRLLKFCFGIPDELHAKGGKQRLLIKNALKDILPEEVLNYRYKGRQAADIGRRLLDHKDELKSEIDVISTVPAAGEYLDISSLYNALENISPELNYSENYKHSSRLLTGLMYGYFFERFG